MAKQLNVSLNFTANTQQVKAQMQELQNQLSALGTTANIPVGKRIKDDIFNATKAAAELKTTLDGAVNVNTGKLDLTKFSTGLKSSGKDLKYYRENLQKLGPEGSQAFLNLATAIQNAEAPLIRTNSLLGEMWTTMKNTARWQFSSSVLHSIQSTFSAALGYVQDLNESLNDIRIVTGQSVEQMADFAREANKAAKTLGTTTTRYTDAALIYYQQGLSDEEVQKRTDATIKMANVTGENAENVSSYMTAIWNNFDDGSKSLEYYADVITKLGAETAASSEEIANGLEKFAAIGDTIGLSYEYATAALTTIVDKTRQSEDVVGTALKTIFARIQGLKVGETTEEGLDLNKYSKALNTYGIQIFDANNNLKDMDSILDDMGEKWQTLSRADKTALAQTVAGVRQYNQLISLMDNWDAMKENIISARNSEGTLQEQAEIYAESWEAASNEVRASMEELYSSIIDDKFMIDLMHFGADAINTIDSVIDGLGGVKGMLLLISSILTTKLGPQMAQGLTSLTMSIGDAFTNGKFSTKIRQDAAQQVSELSNTSGLDADQVEYYKQIGILTEEYEANVAHMSELEKQVNQHLIDRQKILQNNSIELKQQIELQEEQTEQARRRNDRVFRDFTGDNTISNQQLKDLREKALTVKNQDELNDFIINDAGELLAAVQNHSSDRYVRAIEAEIDAISNLARAKASQAENDKKIIKGQEDAVNTIKKSTGAYQYWATTIVSAAQAVSSLGMALSSISSINDVLQDDTLTNWEKFTSITTSLIMIIPMLINGAQGLSSAIKTLSAAQTSSLLFASGAGTVKTIFKELEKNIGNVSNLTSILSRVMAKDTAATVANKIATEGLTGANKKLITSSLGLKLSLGKLAIALAAIAAVIGTVIFIYNKLQDINNKFRNEAKETEKILKSTSERFQEISTSIKDVNDSLDALDSKYKTLDKLTQGSAEWREQLYEINSEVQDIIDKYNLQEGIDWDRTSDGAKYITDEGNKKVEEKNAIDQINAKSAQDSANYIDTISTDKATKEEILHNKKYSTQIQRGTQTVYDAGEDYEMPIYETVGLSQSGLDSIISLLNQNPSFNLTNEKDLLDAGFNEADAEIISSNTDLQKAIQELTVSTDAAKEAYEQNIADSLLLDSELSKKIYGENSAIEEEYRSDLLNQMAQDIESAVTTAVESGKLTQDPESKAPITVESAISDYLEYANIISENGKYFQKNSEGEKGEEIDAKKIEEAAIAYKEQQTQIKKVHNEFKKYQTAVEKSIKVWEKVKTVQDIEGQIGAWSKLKKAIEENSGTNLDNIKSYSEYDQVKSVLVDILDLEEDQADALDPTFIQNNLGLIDEAINGNADSLNNLKAKFEEISGQEVLVKVGLIENTEEQLDGELGTILSQIQSKIDDLEVGAELDLTKFLPELERMVREGEISCKQLENFLSLNGFEGISIEPKYKKVRIGRWQNFIKGNGFRVTYEQQFAGFEKIGGTNDPGTTTDSDGNQSVVLTRDSYSGKTENDLSTENKVIGEKKAVNSGNLNKNNGNDSNNSKNNKNNKSSGSESKVDKVDKTKKTDIVDRYKQINDTLDDQSKKLDQLNTKHDQLYGKNRLKNIEKITNALKAENKALEQKKKQAKANLKIDKKTMQSNLKAAQKKAGLKNTKFKFDKDGDISNYYKVMNALYKKLHKKENEYNSKYAGKIESDASKAAKKRLEKFKDQIDNLKDAISQYDETKNLVEEISEEIQDNLNEIRSNNYEKLSYKIELRITVNENDKKELEYYFNKLDTDIYKSAEALSYLYNKDGDNVISNTKQALENNSKAIEELNKQRELALANPKKGKGISQADYVKGLQEQLDSLYDNLEALRDLDNQMMEYYGNTLNKASEELSKYTSQMDHLTSVLDHYQKVLELTGKGQDYEAMDKVLQGQSKTLKNNFNVSKANYEMLEKEKKSIEEKISKMDQTSAAYELEKKKLEEITTATNEAYEEMLGDAESYLETLQKIWENSLENIKKKTSDTLTGGLGFDILLDSMSNLKTYQDEYLTNTNKLFETNKLLSQIQTDIDKTSNVAAKQRYKAFSQEIEQLQKKDELSNLELEIAQAKYKQLQAQMALEEAQNAKSTVRLSRDNEGNYGYVYTADQNAVNDAQNALAQAENDLYNIRLNATNNYGEKMVQAQKEYIEKIAEIDKEYADDDVKRTEARKKAKEEYYNIINAYSKLYSTAQQEDIRVQEDAWINYYDDIINKGDEWKTTLNDYTDQTEKKFQEWQTETEKVTEAIGLDMGTLSEKVKSVTDQSDTLAKTATESVIPAMTSEIEKVNELTTAYGAQRDAIKKLIEEKEKLAKDTKNRLAEESGEASEWNASIRKKIKSLQTQGYNVAEMYDQNNQLHYTTYDPKKMTKEQVEAKLEKRWDSISSEVAEKNEKTADKINDLKKGEKVYRGYAADGTYYYHKKEKELLKILNKHGGKKPGTIIAHYDTGGYTGKWGPEGKLAVLHEKELVLHKEDTNNLLKIIEIVRNVIDGNVATAGFGQLRAAGISTNNETLEQNVTITAEFPNATDHNEIEQAFDSLINRAAQFANRKK